MLRRLVSRRRVVVAIPLLLLAALVLRTTYPARLANLDLDIDLAALCAGDLRALSPLSPSSSTTDSLYDGPLPLVLDAEGAPHPIPAIVADARRRQRALLREQTHSPEDAARAYRRRRGRHPPPGFDEWARYALAHDAVLVESFWDRIYHDTAPFWALDPGEIARRASTWEHVVRVRKGKASFAGNIEGRVPWMQLWTALVAEVARKLPDVDVPINMMDESRLLVPWEQIARLVDEERKTRVLVDKERATNKYSGPPRPPPGAAAFTTKWYDKRTPFWELLRLTCPPGSSAHATVAIADYAADSPTVLSPDYSPPHAFAGYVVNATASADVCAQPHLRGMHGSLILPISLNTSQDLLPVFGGSKLRTNNEILIPGAMYLTDDKFYSGGNWHGPRWTKKKTALVWRGDATGGETLGDNWARFQRHRLVQMLNGTVVSGLENATGPEPATLDRRQPVAQTFALPPADTYPSARRRNGTLGTWLSSFADAGFVHRLCEPDPEPAPEPERAPHDSEEPQPEPERRPDPPKPRPGRRSCAHVDPYLAVAEGVDMAKQYAYKFLPDADGNSFSARFRGFLLSTSLPLKATIYTEWHDDRLAPWVHYVPLDNSFRDLYGVLEFFADAWVGEDDGQKTTTARATPGDDLARQIAEDGKVWAEKVLRREDMLLYVWRLLLEWARICDAHRDTLAYVGDL
jgi:hypothetical protein